MNPTEHILQCFERLSAIPRGTDHESGLRLWLQEWASARGLNAQADAAGNLVIRVPASAGYEDKPTIILQGHMDMVCQKTPDSDHDFTRDPIKVIREGNWVHADKTTLGADNGAAIAMMMALAEEPSMAHPALEYLLTVAEETGMTGAEHVDPALLTGKTLINMDSEQEGELTVGCAGGGSVVLTLPVRWSKQTSLETAVHLKVGGLKGGHSGGDIANHRTNGNKLLGRFLNELQKDASIRLSTLKGGSARNAIPRDAEAIFVLPKEAVGGCRQRFTALLQAVRAETQDTEPGLWISLEEKSQVTVEAISRAESMNGIRLLFALPDGVAAFSAEVEGSVETSNNIGVMELKKEGLSIVSNHRSSKLSRLEESIEQVEAIGWLAGAQIEQDGLHEPWQPNMDSPLLKKCVQVYEELYHKKAKVMVIHGGLECSMLSEKMGGLDTISFGPTIESPHSPNERLYVPSLEKTWTYLGAILAK